MKFGVENSNYRHGNYSGAPDVGEFKVAMAKDLLRKILGTPCDSGGRIPFTTAEQQWAMKVWREKPEWAQPVLKEFGLGSDAF